MVQNIRETSQSPLNPALLERLWQTLELETEQYRQAVDALQRKKNALVSRKPQTLLPIDRELMAISRKAAQIGQERQCLMNELGHSEGRLEALIEQVRQYHPEAVGKIRDARQRLLGVIEEMGRLNQESRSLLDLSLKWIQETVDLITSAISPEAACYNAQGGKKKASGAPPPIQSTVNHSA
jgi:chromosome segregation ATPase